MRVPKKIPIIILDCLSLGSLIVSWLLLTMGASSYSCFDNSNHVLFRRCSPQQTKIKLIESSCEKLLGRYISIQLQKYVGFFNNNIPIFEIKLYLVNTIAIMQ